MTISDVVCRCLCGAVQVLAAAFIAMSAAPLAQATETVLLDESTLRAEIRDIALRSPYRMSEQARRGTIQYRLSQSAGAPWPWPETGEQRARRVGKDVLVTVCADCGREPPPSDAMLEQYRAATPWLQHTDPAIARFARVAGAGSVERRMQRLVQAVREHLIGPLTYDEYASARDAFEQRNGDCTEFALLLAAAARSRGIPTRVVAGVAYGSSFVGVPHAFGPHMWVQAWNGERWVSYDAGLGRFDAGHIALAVGDGSPESLRGVMQAIRSLRVVDAAGVIDNGP